MLMSTPEKEELEPSRQFLFPLIEGSFCEKNKTCCLTMGGDVEFEYSRERAIVSIWWCANVCHIEGVQGQDLARWLVL